MAFIGSVPYTEVTGRPSVAASTILDLRPAAGKFRQISISIASYLNAFYAMYDGTNYDSVSNFAGLGCQPGYGTSTRGYCCKNADGANPNVLAYSGWDIG